EEEWGGSRADLLRLLQRLRDDQIGRRMRLPWRRVMLADPRLPIAQLVGPPQRLEIPLVTGVEAALRRMRRHGEQSEIHHVPPGVGWNAGRANATILRIPYPSRREKSRSVTHGG